MQSIRRWMAKNRTLAKVLACTSMVTCYSSLLLLDVPLWIVLIIDLFMVFYFSVWVDVSIGKLVQPAIQMMNEQCDPYPLLEETARQMHYGYKGTMEQTNIINHACALRNCGQYQQALDLLLGINIDRNSGTLPAAKFVYYNNLSDLMTLMCYYAEAEVWYQKQVQIFGDMPENKIKKSLRQTMESATASAWFRRGEYAKAQAALNAMQPKELSHQVGNALLYARCCIAQGYPEGARQPLQFVLDNGNRFFAVQEARDLLSKL